MSPFGSWPGNAALCGDKVRARFGAHLHTLEAWKPPWREIARATLDVGEHLTVTHVVEDSPAHAAGLAVGDRVLRLNGETLGVGKGAPSKWDAIKRRARPGAEFALTIARRGESRDLTLQPTAACDYPVHLLNKNDVNAWADGTKIYLTTGMLRFTRNDAELALVIGHELAHNTRGHIESKVGNQLLGTLLGAAITAWSGVDVTNIGAQAGRHAFSQEFEAEADYVGVYHAGRGGYDLRGAASFWRRLGAAHPKSIHLAGSTHPSTAKRFLAIEQALSEFERKSRNNLPLIPEERARR